MKKIFLLITILGAGYYYTTLQNKSKTPKHTLNAKSANKKLTTNHGSNSNKAISASIGIGGKVVSSKSNAHVHADTTSNDFEVEIVSIPDTLEGESLVTFNSIMADSSSKNLDIESLKESLVSKGLELVVAKDENKFTGTMTIIRTENSLPGTRYFHSQIFYGEDGSPFVQHMSFEYRAGKLAFAQAVAAAKKQFKLNTEPSVKKDGFYSWNTSDGYVVWVKRMTSEDLKNDPFNAYSPSDAGTIKVAKELEIH
jgi:hypothetical protein